MVCEHRHEFPDSGLVLTQHSIRPSEFPSRIPILDVLAQPFAQLGHEPVVIPGIGIGKLEIPLGDCHLGIQLDSRAEAFDRFLDQPFAKIQNAEVVVRSGIQGIDAAGE